MTFQNVCNRMKHRVVADDTIKKYSLPVRRPSVPGPRPSARMLIRAKEPLMKPKPKPHTYANASLQSAMFIVNLFKPLSALRSIQYSRYL